MHVDGADLTGEPLQARQKRLPEVLGDSGLLLSTALPGSPEAIVKAVRGLGLEGVIAKRKHSVYVPGERSDDWQKLKLDIQQEFVIGGYRAGANGVVDALLVGYYDDAGLRSRARCGLASFRTFVAR